MVFRQTKALCRPKSEALKITYNLKTKCNNSEHNDMNLKAVYETITCFRKVHDFVLLIVDKYLSVFKMRFLQIHCEVRRDYIL